MSTEKTAFDTWLKDRLWRDLMFRGLILVVLSGLTIAFSSQSADFAPVQFFKSISDKLRPLIDTVGVVVIFVSVVALLFKDLEEVDPTHWDQSTKRGKFGGFLRRFSSDMTLWLIGSFFALLSAAAFTTVAEVVVGRVDRKDALILTVFFVQVCMSIATCSLINMLIRIEKPFLTTDPDTAKMFDRPSRVITFWAAVFVILFVTLRFI